MRARVLLALVVALSAPPAALAGPLVDQAASALESDPVYVHPDAEPGITEAEAGDLRTRIAESGEPIFVAVLPAAARDDVSGNAVDVLRELGAAGPEGTYAVVVGGQFRAGSSVLPSGRAAELATEAFQDHREEGVAPTLLAFVDLVADEAAGGGDDGGGGGGISPAILAVLGAVAAAIAFLFVRRRRKRAQGFADVRQAAQEELAALADDVQELEAPVSEPGADPAAGADYEQALEHYERASRAFDRARKTEDFAEVTTAVEEGRYAMASVKARLDGRTPPERRPPCFFDPRHGPSIRDVEWAPPGGAPREVPACEADAIRVENGEEPSVRDVPVGGQRVPYWSAPAYYGPYTGGFFGAGSCPFSSPARCSAASARTFTSMRTAAATRAGTGTTATTTTTAAISTAETGAEATSAVVAAATLGEAAEETSRRAVRFEAVFTGIVRELGQVEAVEEDGRIVRLRVRAPDTAAGAAVGDSVALNGVCLTATLVGDGSLSFDAVEETLSRSTLGRLRPGVEVNIESALHAGEPLGGHFVQGHVDGVGRIRRVDDEGIEVEAPAEILRYCVEKGSIAVEGVSLTIASLADDGFSVALIPHTREATTLGRVREGDEVNLEADILAKHVERLLAGLT